MGTAGPAAWPAHAVFELLLGPADATVPRLLLLRILDPTDELVAGERSDVLPRVERRGIGNQCAPQVTRELVHDATGHTDARHGYASTLSRMASGMSKFAWTFWTSSCSSRASIRR